MEDNDAQLLLKKRARRRLVGALFFVSIVAIVLPMVMDHEPRQQVQEVEIRIPGQDDKPFAPKFAAPAVAPVEKPTATVAAVGEEVKPAKPVAVEPKPSEAAAKPTARVVETNSDKPQAKPVEKVTDKPAEKPAAKPEKPTDKQQPKPEPAKADDAKRAAAILAGQAEAKPSAAKGGEFLILIGAFSNEENVKNLKTKLGEQGIKTFSEPLDTPQGKKTRVRAGPFPSREAADKALEKMKRIGVSGVVAAKP
ncbi:SPOR domain-containing protein [Azonexus sp. IMCC34839]|uniref:SPOR domain-containing protein n=1 Tax=Azonexus sp. IMCC34839 TaxID=3133695 RepID=UPI00399A9F3E